MTDIPTLRGVDVSTFQGGAIDWHAVKAAGASFAGTKCSEGVGYLDATFHSHWEGIAATQLTRIAYHFARPDLHNAAVAEADWFLRCLGALQVGDIIALDIEVEAPNVDVAAWCLAWLRHVEQAVGFAPLVYTYLDYARTRLQRAELASYPLWLALYGQPCPAAVPPWTSVTLWQWRDDQTYPGIPTLVDESVVDRDLAGLRALGKPSPAPPTEKPAAGPVYRYATVATDMWLRRLPRADSARLVNLPVGTVLQIYGPPTTHWANVRAPDGQVGWVLISNCRLSVDKPA